MFDNIFYSVFKLLKPKFGKRANNLAIIYLSILQILLVLVIGIFLKAFLSNMNQRFLSDDKFLILSIVAAILIFLKNWIQYSGRKRKVKNTKISQSKDRTFSVYGLVLFPVGCIILLLVLNQAV